jgi:hypothetical protein
VAARRHDGSSPGSAGDAAKVWRIRGSLHGTIDETPNRDPPSTRKGVPPMDNRESSAEEQRGAVVTECLRGVGLVGRTLDIT